MCSVWKYKFYTITYLRITSKSSLALFIKLATLFTSYSTNAALKSSLVLLNTYSLKL